VDKDIWAWFDSTAFPPAPLVAAVLDAVTQRGPISVPALEGVVNLRRSRIESMLKVLDVEGAVERAPDGWVATRRRWRYDHDRVARVGAARAAEAAAMVAYATTDGCRMRHLRECLDDVGSGDCGHCDTCAPATAPRRTVDPDLSARALAHLRSAEVALEPRRQWAGGISGRKGAIPAGRRAERGRALAFGNDPGWAEVLDRILADPAAPLDPAVTDGITAALRRWQWEARPTWVTWIPSVRRPLLGRAVAAHIAAVGRLPLHEVLRRTGDRPAQEAMANSARQAGNVLGAFTADLPGGVGDGPVLVVDDTWSSGWTMTVVADELRAAGSGPVLPFALWRRP
jgi:ATP-dependent DNA helicase RecQ